MKKGIGMDLFRCDRVSMYYERTAVLENVSFNVQRGDCLCIVGENGSGKSTLLKGILGLHPIRSGEVCFSAALDRRKIGYLPQQSGEQRDFPAKVFEVVRSGCLNRAGLLPLYSASMKKTAQDAMERLHIQDYAKKSFRELSGGQRQRVLLARALCAAQELLLLDEPVTGLDPLISTEFYALVGQLHQKAGKTIVMVSHDVNSAVGIANKILHLQNAVAFFGATQSYTESTLGKHFMRGCCHCD